ncbi:hypothetical protein TWF696_001460 [Orbilia brochopaga]|uniref:Rhodopsin domain-containing protein n=1 Tax=Orbilia brochopaga TaxID=3140254 RepID=A0AAV9U915_9PEZI
MGPVTTSTAGNPTSTPDPSLAGFDLSDTRNYIGEIYAVNISMIVLVITALILRLYSRQVLVKRIQSDDVFVILGTNTAVVYSALCIYSMKYLGLGVHIWLEDPETKLQHSMKLIKIMIAMYILYSFSLTMAKCCVITLYLRIFFAARWFRIAVFSILFLVIVIFLLNLFVPMFACQPINAAWDPRVKSAPGTKCIPIHSFFYVTGSLNIFTDLLLVALPMPLAWQLGLTMRKRILIVMLFSLGILASVASVVRITNLDALGSKDFTFKITSSVLWTIIEADVALICASGPAIKPLIARVVPHLSQSFTSSPVGASAAGTGTITYRSNRGATHQSSTRIRTSTLRSNSETYSTLDATQATTASPGYSYNYNGYKLQVMPSVKQASEETLGLPKHSTATREEVELESPVHSRMSLSSGSVIDSLNPAQPTEPLSPPPAVARGCGAGLQIYVSHDVDTDVERR